MRRILVVSRLKILGALALIGVVWAAIFFVIGRSFAQPQVVPIAKPTLEVMDRFTKLTKKERELFSLPTLIKASNDSKQVVAVLEFSTLESVPIRAPSLDGFLTQYVNIYHGSNGVGHVYAAYTRITPYVWPRVLDVSMGPGKPWRGELDERHSTDNFARYRILNTYEFQMESPNGHFAWTTSKDSAVLNDPTCLFRQDVYKNGEYVKSLAAIATKPIP